MQDACHTSRVSKEGRTSSGRFQKGTSGNANGRRGKADGAPADTRPPITDPRFDVGDLLGNPGMLTKRAQLLPTRGAKGPLVNGVRKDDWKNVLTGQGVSGRDKRVGGFFAPIALSFDQLRDLWFGDDLAAVAVEMLPKEARRPGWDITVTDADEDKKAAAADEDGTDLGTQLKDKLHDLDVDGHLELAGQYARAYGGGAVLLGVNDKQEDLTKELDLNKVVSLDWLTTLEARECIPRWAYGDPRAPKYGQPEIYQLTSRTVLPSRTGSYGVTSIDVHESRLLIFDGIRVSRYQNTSARGGWGESVLTRVWRVLRDFNTAWSAAGVLVSDFAQTVIKMAGLWAALDADGGQAFEDRLTAMDVGRSTLNAITIDAADSFERQQTPLTGLPDLLEKFAVRLAAACGMPLTLLFGTSPAGMNATGESDIRFFYDRVDEYRQKRIKPALRRLIQILFRTLGNKREPAKWGLEFRPLWQESAKDLAGAMLTQAQADTAWITAGVLSPEEVAAAHWRGGKYNPHLAIDFEAREALEAAAAAPVLAPGPEGDEEPDPEVPSPSPAGVELSEPSPGAKPVKKTDADWDESAHPRGEGGKFGAGVTSEHREQATASLQNKTFLAANRSRLIAAGDEVRARWPQEERAKDAVHDLAQQAIHEEAARIHAEHEAHGGAAHIQEAANEARVTAAASGKSSAEAHEAALQAIAETKTDDQNQAAARAAGVVPEIPEAAGRELDGAVTEQDAKLDATRTELDDAQAQALEALDQLHAIGGESLSDEDDVPTAVALSDSYAEAADRLGGHGDDAGAAAERYGGITSRDIEAPEAPEPHESLVVDEDGDVEKWEPDDGWAEAHIAESDEAFDAAHADDDFDDLHIGDVGDDKTEMRALPYDEATTDLDHEEYVKLAAEYNAAREAHEAQIDRDIKQHNTQDKLEHEQHAKEYEAAVEAHDATIRAAAIVAQDRLEALHEKQIDALQQAKAASKALTPFVERSEDELSADDADDRVGTHPAFSGAAENKDGSFADPATQKLYDGAVSAHTRDLEAELEARAVSPRYDKETHDAIKGAIKETAAAIKALAVVTGRKAKLSKPLGKG